MTKRFEKKLHKIEIRMTDKQKKKIKILTKLYGYKSMSKWIVDALAEWRPKFKD